MEWVKATCGTYDLANKRKILFGSLYQMPQHYPKAAKTKYTASAVSNENSNFILQDMAKDDGKSYTHQLLMSNYTLKVCYRR